MRRLAQAFVLAAALAAVPAAALLPVYQWEVQGAQGNQNTPSVVQMAASGITVAATGTALGTYQITGVNTETGDVVWTQQTLCSALVGVYPVPNAAAPDAIAVAVCSDVFVGIVPSNGTFQWTIMPGVSGTLSPVPTDDNSQPLLPVVITPSSETSADKFVIPLYPADGNSGLTLLAIVDPTQGRVTSAEVPCFDTIQAIHATGPKDFLTIVCAPGSQATLPGPTTVKGVSITSGRLTPQWEWVAPTQLAAATAASQTTVLALAYRLATGMTNSFTSYYTIDIATGAASELSVNQISAAQPFLVNNAVPKLAWAGGMSFAFVEDYTFSVGAISSNTLSFVMTRMGNTNGDNINFLSIVAIPDSGMQQVVLAQNNNNGALAFTVYNPATGAVLLNFMPNGQTYGNRLHVDYCPDSRKVLVWGYNQVSSWLAATGTYTVLFTADIAATSASILQDYVAFSGQASAYGVVNVGGNTWEVAQTNTGSASFATSNGAVFSMTPAGVAAYGSRGTRLWLTPFAIGDIATELVVMKDIVVLVIGAAVIGMSQSTGAILFEITLTAYKTNGFSCSVPVTGSTLVAGASATAAVDSFLVIGQMQSGNNNVEVTNAPPACTYLVRTDGTAMTLRLTSIQSAVRAASGNDLIVQSDTVSARIDGWTGATKWSAPVFVGVQASTVYATPNVVYVITTSSGNSRPFVAAVDAVTGTMLFDLPTSVVSPVGTLGDGLLMQEQKYNSNTGNYEYGISNVVPKIAANGSVVASTSWSSNWGSDSNTYFAGVRGVLVGFGGPACAMPSTYYAQCMAGYSAETGDPLWSISDIGSNCESVTSALGGAVVIASCGATLKAVDPLTGAVRFVAPFPYQTFRVTADVVVQQSGGALAGSIIPPANLVRAYVNASSSLPMPAPFQLPAGYTPAPSAPPGPAPVPSAANLGGNADVAWSMETPGSTANNAYDGAASTSAVNGVVLIASSVQLTFVMADSGSAVKTVPAPADCVAANTQPRVYASPSQFFCECGALTITSYDAAGTKLWSTVIPGGGSNGNNGQLPFLLADGSILVPTAATTTALANILLGNGTSIFLRLPEEFSENQQTITFDSIPSGGFIVYTGSVLGVYTSVGDQLWNHTLDRGSFNKINLAVAVANGDVVAIVTANNDNAIAVRFNADTLIWRVLVETSQQEGSDYPQGVLTAGAGTAADYVYFGSTATNVVYGLQVTTGRIIWSFTTDYSSVSALIGMGATEQCCIFTGVLTNYNNEGNTYASVTCADPATGNVRFNVTYLYNGEQDAVTVSASPSPTGDSVLVAAGRYIANVSLVTKQPFWAYSRAQYYGGQFAPAKYIPTADGTGRVIVSVDGSSNPIRALVASVSTDRFVFAAEVGTVNNNNAPSGSPFVSVTNGAAVAIVANSVLYAASTATGAVQWSISLGGGLPPTSAFAGSGFVTAFATYVVVARSDRMIVVDAADGSIVSTYAYAGLSSTCNPTSFGTLSLFVEEGHLVLNIGNCLYFFSSTLRIHGFRLTQVLVEPPRGVSNLVTFQAQDGAVVALQPDGVPVWSAPVHELAGYYGSPAASNSGGSSFLYTATYDGYLTSRLGTTGAIVWRVRTFPRPALQQQTFNPMPPAVIGNVVLVATPTGVSAYDASLNPSNSTRIVWQTNVPGVNYNSQQNDAPRFTPVVSTVGVAIFYLDGVLFGVNFTDGTLMWSKAATCTSATSFGRFVIAACDDVIALDPITGRGVAQLGFGLTTQGLAVFGTPSGSNLPRVAVAFNPQSNANAGAVSISSLIATSMAPAAPPVPTPSQAPATLPPNYVPDVPKPVQSKPFFDYASTPPHGEINFTWPVLSNAQIATNVGVTTLFQSRTTLVAMVGNQLMGYSVAIGSPLWTAPVPPQCLNSNGQAEINALLQAKGNALVLYCSINNNNGEQYHLVYLSESTGKVTDTVVLNSFASQMESYVADPVSNAVLGSYYTYRYDSNSGNYVYTYGAIGASPTAQWTYNCSSSSSSSYPSVTPYNGYAVVVCISGQVAWIDAATGEVAAEFAAANQTAATAVSSEGRYVALLGSSSLSASQVTLFDGMERKIVGFYGLNPTLGTNNFVLVPDNAGSVWFIQIYGSNQTLNGYKLPLSAGTSGIQISRSWTAAPFEAFTQLNQQITAFISGTNIFVNAYGANGAVSLTTGATLWANYPSGIYSVSSVSASPTADVVLFGSNSVTVAYKLSTGQLLTQGPGVSLQPDGILYAENCAVVSGQNDQGFSCFSVSPVTAGWARHTHSNSNQGVSPSTDVVGLLNGNIIVSTAYDVSSFNAATGTQQYSLTLSAGHAGYPVLAGTKLVAFTTFGGVWVIDAVTGVVDTTLVLPLCSGAVSPGASASAVYDGTDLLFTGSVGCLYRISFAASTPAITLVASSGASELTTVVVAPTQILWVDDSAGLHAFDRTTLAKQWTLQMPDTGFNTRGVVAYGAFVYVTSSPRTLLVLKAVNGAVAREIPAVTHLLTGAMTAYNGAIWAVTGVGIAKYPADPTSTAAPTHMVTVGSSQSVAPSRAQNPKVSADGVLVYTSNIVAAAIDTVSGTVLWNSSSAPSPHTNNRKTRPDTFVIVGDVIVGGVERNFAVRGLRTGIMLRSWGISAPSFGGRVLVSGGIALYATYLNSVAGLPIGIKTPAAPVPTATAPANSDVPTAPPPTPFATQAASGASLGCVRRIDTETALLRACVSSTVVAPLYEGRAAGVSTLDCARGAPALASCVANYAATMAGCGAGIAYLREVLASINATGAPLAACGRAGVCTTAAGEAAFCAALDVPSWAAAAGPLPATGLPPIPTFTSAAATTTSVVTTTTLPTTTTTAPTGSARPTPSNSPSSSPRPTGTSGPSGSPQPTGTNGPTGGPGALPAVIALQLEAGATIPTGADIAMSTKQALGLTYDPDVELFGMLGTNTVLFAFRGADASSLTQRTLALSATSLHVYFHSSKVTTAAPPDASPAPAGKTPGWVIPVVIVLGVLVVAFAAIFAVKRKQLMGSRVDVEGPSPSINSTGSAAELHSGRIQTGGEYTRYEDMA